MDMDLRSLTYATCQPLRPHVSEAIVVKIVDGDTVHLGYYDGDAPTRICVRLKGIDTAEIHSKDEREKACAQYAKAYLESLVQGQVLDIHLDPKADKYGRWLAVLIRKDGAIVNREMLKWAVEYDGKTKKTTPETWRLMLETHAKWGDLEAAADS
jgi:endonuclease YncB( thermonuclease family)